MNIKRLKIILFIILIVFSITATMLFFTNDVYAAEGEINVDGIIDEANDFIDIGEEEIINQQDVKSFSDTIYNALLAIGMIVAVIVGSILGIQYMMSTAEGKAESKKKLVSYFVGCAILFSCFGIWSITVNFLQNTEQESSNSSSISGNGESQGQGSNEQESNEQEGNGQKNNSEKNPNGQPSNNNNESNVKYTLKLSKTQLTVYRGDNPKKVTLKAQVLPKNANANKEKIMWTTSNSNIATVTQSGVVTLKQKGNVIITAKLASNSNVTASCNINVKDIQIKLKKGNTLMLTKHRYNFGYITVKVQPSNAKVRYSSSNTKVATVNPKNGKVKAKRIWNCNNFSNSNI